MKQESNITTQSLSVKPTSRGVRVWLEDSPNQPRLAQSGFVKGARYTRTIANGVITMRLDPEGKKKVSGKQRPIIDISAKHLDGLNAGDELTAVYSAGMIVIGKS